MDPTDTDPAVSEADILEKTRLGLTRDQAIEILTNQAAHDAVLAAEDKKTAKKTKA